MLTTDVIFFAIQSALRLSEAARQAYVDSTRNRGLVLPLPDFDPHSNGTLAYDYFVRVHPDLPRPKALSGLLEKYRDHSDQWTSKDEGDLVAFHLEACLTEPGVDHPTKPLADGTFFTQQSLNVLVDIRQWERGAAADVSPLQRVAGTIVEIAIDYYAHVPGALNQQSVQGKALHTLLTTIEGIDFASVPIGDLPAKLFMATADTIAQSPALFTGDPDAQQLISVTSKALANDVKDRIEKIRASYPQGDNVGEQHVIDWADLVFRSVLSSGVKTALQDPKRYLGVDNAGTAALVDHVGVAALDFVLSQPSGSIDRVFGREGLDVVVRAALQAVGEHPEIVTSSGNAGLRKLLAESATELGKFDSLVAPGTLPEVMRVVLERTGDNLPLIWPDQNDPKRHLLLTAAAETLEVLTKKDGGNWNPRFSRTELLDVVNTVLDEFLKDPGWLVDSAGAQSGNLGAALEAVVGVLRERGDERLTRETGIEVLQSALKAISKRKAFLDQIPGGQVFAGALIDTILGRVFAKDLGVEAQWSLVRQNVVTAAVDRAFAAAAGTDAAQPQIDALATALDTQIADLVAGKPFDLDAFLTSVETAIAQASGESGGGS